MNPVHREGLPPVELLSAIYLAALGLALGLLASAWHTRRDHPERLFGAGFAFGFLACYGAWAYWIFTTVR